MINSLDEIVFIHSIPCIIVFCMIAVMLIASRCIKRSYYYLRIGAALLFVVGTTIQLIYGASFQEVVLIASIEATLFLLTMNTKIKETKEIE